MKRFVSIGLIALSVPAVAAAQGRGGGRGAADSAPPATRTTEAPEIPFDSIPDFLKLPEGMNFGEVPGVAVNSKGHIFVFTRSNSAYGPAYGPTADRARQTPSIPIDASFSSINHPSCASTSATPVMIASSMPTWAWR